MDRTHHEAECPHGATCTCGRRFKNFSMSNLVITYNQGVTKEGSLSPLITRNNVILFFVAVTYKIVIVIRLSERKTV